MTAQAAIVPGALDHALADELVRITGELATLAFDLGSDARTLRRHMASLQAIDRITQAQLGIADVLRTGGDAAARLGVLTVEEQAQRLAAAMGAHVAG